jgi:hypothetical protein
MGQKMNPRIKALWVNELRNGGHEQGVEALCRLKFDKANPEYCCLGILCEIAVREGVIKPAIPIYRGGSDETLFDYADEPTNLLPAVVQRWAGLSSEDPEVDAGNIGRTEESLAGLNDSGASFAEIAQIIEEQL